MSTKSPSKNSRPYALPFVENGPVYTPGRAPASDNNVKRWRLSSNESPLGTSQKVQDAVVQAAATQHLYPDADGLPLTQPIAEKFDLDPSRILIAPGSDSIINWIVRGWAGPGDEVVYSAHGFQSYRIRAATAGVTPVAANEKGLRTDVDALLGKVTDRTKLMFVANPNNPTGTYLTPTEIRDLRDRLRSDVMLVVDEAYFDFVRRDDYESAIHLVESGDDNVIVTRTFSKFYGLAGARVGWAYAPHTAMAPLTRMRGPFSISNIGLAAAKAALEDDEYAAISFAHNDQWVFWLKSELAALGYETTDSVGNFVLMKIPGGDDAAIAFVQALNNAGFSTRRADQNGLLDWVRISVGVEEANRGVIEAIKRCCQTNANQSLNGQ
jgi:histidinol-phosphate aminotransferase